MAAVEHSLRDQGVTIAPFNPGPTHYASGELDVEMEMTGEAEADEEEEAAFIPPVAEAPPSRMPRVEDFPAVAQRQIEARQVPGAPEEDRGPLSLLRRLASVGLGRREEDPIGAGPQAAGAAAVTRAGAAARPRAAPAAQRLRQAAAAASGGE